MIWHGFWWFGMDSDWFGTDLLICYRLNISRPTGVPCASVFDRFLIVLKTAICLLKVWYVTCGFHLKSFLIFAFSKWHCTKRVWQLRCRSTERVAHSRVKFQPRVDETLRWKVPADLPDPGNPGNPGNQVSSAAVRNHSNTRAGGEDYVSSNQTPSNNMFQR